MKASVYTPRSVSRLVETPPCQEVESRRLVTYSNWSVFGYLSVNHDVSCVIRG